MIKAILFDIDGTLLDFLQAEKNAIKKVFAKFELGEFSDDKVQKYSEINLKHWEMLERGEIGKSEVMHLRFVEFLKFLGRDTSLADEINKFYESSIPSTTAYIENADEICADLATKYDLYCVTNGALKVQTERLKKSGLDKLFKGIFISDEIGFEKPSLKFFEPVLKAANCKKSEIMIIGDSLTSDMKGGNGVGIKCCYYNPCRIPNTTEIKTDYEIASLSEIYNVLQKENEVP